MLFREASLPCAEPSIFDQVRLEELVFLVGENGAVRGGVRHTCGSLLVRRLRADAKTQGHEQVRTKPSDICESSRKDWSDWSTVPAVTLPQHDEQAPARHE